MENNGVMVFIKFWAFMVGVAIFGKLSGAMDTTKNAFMILLAGAILFAVWQIASAKGRAKREARAYANRTVVHKGAGKKR